MVHQQKEEINFSKIIFYFLYDTEKNLLFV
jgi:hypothetical protein